MTAKVRTPTGELRWPRTVVAGSVGVKVYRVAHATNASGEAYVLAWHSAQGRKTQKFADPEKALAEAKLKASQLAAGKIDAADMTSSDRSELQAARRLAGNVPLLAALAEWAKVRELTGGQAVAAAEAWAARNSTRLDRITVSTAIDRFLKAKDRAGVDTSCSYSKIFPALDEALGARMLDTLSARELQHWLDTRYAHPVSRNTARKRIVALWRWARKQGSLARDAMTEAEQTDHAREEAAEIGVIDSPTFAQLLNHFAARHPECVAALAIAGFCGLRRSEIHAQTWEDVLLERGFVRVTAAKRNTPSRRLVPLSASAVEWLMRCPKRSGPICGNLAIDRIRDIARTAKDAAGKPIFPALPDNAFRHSFISHRVAATGDVATTSLEAGNSPGIIFKHYRELFTKQEGEAWFRISPSTAGTVIQIGTAAHA